MVLSTTAAGTINQMARGFSSFLTNSGSDEAPTAFSATSSSTAFGDMSKTTQLWPALSSRRTMFAPILPSPIIPSCINAPFAACRFQNSLTLSFSGKALPSRRVSLRGMRFFENVHKLAIATSYFGDGVFPRNFLGQPAYKRLPKIGPAHGETHKTRNRRGRSQPFAYFLVVLAAAEDDAADLIAAVPAGYRHNTCAILAAI